MKAYSFFCKWLLGRGRKTEGREAAKEKYLLTHPLQAEVSEGEKESSGEIKGKLKAKGFFALWVSGTKPLRKRQHYANTAQPQQSKEGRKG